MRWMKWCTIGVSLIAFMPNWETIKNGYIQKLNIHIYIYVYECMYMSHFSPNNLHWCKFDMIVKCSPLSIENQIEWPLDIYFSFYWFLTPILNTFCRNIWKNKKNMRNSFMFFIHYLKNWIRKWFESILCSAVEFDACGSKYGCRL